MCHYVYFWQLWSSIRRWSTWVNVVWLYSTTWRNITVSQDGNVGTASQIWRWIFDFLSCLVGWNRPCDIKTSAKKNDLQILFDLLRHSSRLFWGSCDCTVPLCTWFAFNNKWPRKQTSLLYISCKYCIKVGLRALTETVFSVLPGDFFFKDDQRQSSTWTHKTNLNCKFFILTCWGYLC